MDVVRVAEDGLSRQVWQFGIGKTYDSIGLCLSSYGIERRKTARAKFSAAKPEERWQASDERRYNSGLSRPTAIPSDVLDEALDQLKISVFIGFFNEACRYDPAKETGNE